VDNETSAGLDHSIGRRPFGVLTPTFLTQAHRPGSDLAVPVDR
jgi:hypothetical protein